MAGWTQSLIIAGLVSVAGLAIRLFAILGPVAAGWSIAVVAGVATFIVTAVLLGMGIAIALLGMI